MPEVVGLQFCNVPIRIVKQRPLWLTMSKYKYMCCYSKTLPPRYPGIGVLPVHLLRQVPRTTWGRGPKKGPHACREALLRAGRCFWSLNFSVYYVVIIREGTGREARRNCCAPLLGRRMAGRASVCWTLCWDGKRLGL